MTRAQAPGESRASGQARDDSRLLAKQVAQKFNGSKRRSWPGRPKIDPEIAELIVQMARESSGWGYDRIVGALANLGRNVSDQTVGNVLCRQWDLAGSEASQTMAWKDFIAAHMAVLACMVVRRRTMSCL